MANVAKRARAAPGDIAESGKPRIVPGSRTTDALARMARRLESMEDKLVSRPSLDTSAFDPGPRARAILRGLELAQDDLRFSGGAYDLEQVRQIMHGVSRQSIEKRVRTATMFSVAGPGNQRRYPVVQFDDDGSVIAGLPAVLAALPTASGFGILNFLIHPDHRLGNRRPIDVLKEGDVESVVLAARAMGEMGA